MTVKAIMFTKEDIIKEMKRLHEYIAEHKKQFYFNGFSVTMASDISEERLIDLLDYGVVQNPKEFQKVTIEDVERYKCMKELID